MACRRYGVAKVLSEVGCYKQAAPPELKTHAAQQAIEKARQALRRQHKALATEETCVFWLRRYVAALRQIPETLSSEKKVRQW